MALLLQTVVDLCPSSAAFFGELQFYDKILSKKRKKSDPSSYFFTTLFSGFMGVSSALVFCNLGAAYGTAKAGVGIASMGIMHPSEVMKNIVPVIMAGLLGIYGLIVAAILVGKSEFIIELSISIR